MVVLVLFYCHEEEASRVELLIFKLVSIYGDSILFYKNLEGLWIANGSGFLEIE